jgi:thioesterase domain-containing protein
MMVPAFLQKLRTHDIWVRAEGDRLLCNAPAGALTPELRDQLARFKPEILAYLSAAAAVANRQRAIVPLQSKGEKPPVFGVGGHNGDVFCYGALARELGEDQPFYGLHPPGLDGGSPPFTRAEDLASYFARQIREFHREGPCVIAGYCAGGVIAFELAQQLRTIGQPIHSLAFFGCYHPTAYRWMGLRRRMEWLSTHMRALAHQSWSERASYVRGKLEARRGAAAQPSPATSAELEVVLSYRRKVEDATILAGRRYDPTRFPGVVNLFIPTREWVSSDNGALRWRSTSQHVNEFFGPEGCTGDNMLREPYVATFAELFRQAMGTTSTAISMPHPAR